MSEQLGSELDMLPVGNGDKSGDAIALRYGNSIDGYKVMVIDGGTLDAGDNLVEHIKLHYGTNKVDFMVCTHPDTDHSSGLRRVMEKMEVGQLWMHRPWLYSNHVYDYITDGRVTNNSLNKAIQESLSTAYSLECMAKERNIPIYEPFQGSQIGVFEVLSPSVDFYKSMLVEQYGDTDEPVGIGSLFKNAMDVGKEVIARVIGETWSIETLREDGKTSPLNETSVVMFASISGYGIMTTGDAGIRALTNAIKFADASMLPLHELRFMQIPHHGSRRNISPSILNRLIGPPLPVGQQRFSPLSACVSASKDSTTHPRKVVTNAFMRRGAVVTGTQGKTILYTNNMPMRYGWGAATPIPFHDVVESYEEVMAKAMERA